MRVTVRLFARLREAAGVAEYDCELAAGATVTDVWRAAAERFPALGEFNRSVSAAVNAEFAKPSASVREGDEVAFLPPVSGGCVPSRRRRERSRVTGR
jgi:molybdopterin converting factor subunit 1